MTNDLLQVLRGQRVDGRTDAEVRAAAAAEIEQLQRKATEWAGIAGTHAGEIYELQQRVAAARALLEPLVLSMIRQCGSG